MTDKSLEDYQERITLLEKTLGNLAQTNANQAITIANLQAIIALKEEEATQVTSSSK